MRFVPAKCHWAVALATALLALATVPARAALVSNVQATHHGGQSFITWSGLPGGGWRYRVYTAAAPITSAGDLASATWLGTAGDSSASDRRLSALLGTPLSYRTDSLAAPLPPSGGLFVTTCTSAASRWYAVTAESANAGEDRTVLAGTNATTLALAERPDAARPIWQRTLVAPRGEDHVLWGGPQATAFTPALWPTASHAFHVGVLPGLPGGALVLGAHGRGGSFLNSLSGAGTPDETVLSIDDVLENEDVGDFYLGFQSAYDPAQGGNVPPLTGTITPWTERRVMHLMGWSATRFAHDPERVYCIGSSMGGTFAMFMALHHPDLVAASFLYVPKLLFNYTPDASPVIRASLDRLWGTIVTDLPVADAGTTIGTWMDARAQVRADRVQGCAPVIGFVGRNDQVVGWPEKLPWFAAAESSLAGGWWFWDGRSHDESQSATWSPMQDTHALGQFRRDRSWPALTHCNKNGDPGDGTTTSGDTLGQLNGYVVWDSTISDYASFWQLTFHLRTLKTRFATLPAPDSLTVDVTPRRLQSFHLLPGAAYKFRVKRVSDRVEGQSGVVTADAQGVVTLKGVRLHRSGDILTLQRPENDAVPAVRGPVSLALFAPRLPLRGDGEVEVRWGPGAPGRVDLFDLAGRRVPVGEGRMGEPISHFSVPTGRLTAGVWFVRALQGTRSASLRLVVLR